LNHVLKKELSLNKILNLRGYPMRKTVMVMPLAVVLLILGGAVSAYANSFTFDFNSLPAGTNAAAISTYMNGVLTAGGCSGCSVTVTGAVADKTYNGDNHVTGPTSNATKSLTLGDSNGATASNTNSTVNSTNDTFIANTNDSSGVVSSEMIIKFNGFTVNGTVAFDYEIFPDGTCPSLSNCGGTGNPNLPDFEFAVNGSTNVWTKYGVVPGTTNGNAVHSPNSPTGTELSPQLIGTYSGSLSGVHELDFIDWPATIGVDNLTITTAEPGTLLLLGMGLSSLFLIRKKQQA
jgi:hypothetical protein